VLKRKQIRPLNQKRRNSFITESNCRTACLGWGGCPQFEFSVSLWASQVSQEKASGQYDKFQVFLNYKEFT